MAWFGVGAGDVIEIGSYCWVLVVLALVLCLGCG